MRPEWDGAAADAAAARRAAAELDELRSNTEGEPLDLGNEFAEVRVSRVRTRNGVRLLVESPRSGQWVTLDPLEVESLTWQDQRTFSALVGRPFTPLFAEDPR